MAVFLILHSRLVARVRTPKNIKEGFNCSYKTRSNKKVEVFNWSKVKQALFYKASLVMLSTLTSSSESIVCLSSPWPCISLPVAFTLSSSKIIMDIWYNTWINWQRKKISSIVLANNNMDLNYWSVSSFSRRGEGKGDGWGFRYFSQLRVLLYLSTWKSDQHQHFITFGPNLNMWQTFYLLTRA